MNRPNFIAHTTKRTQRVWSILTRLVVVFCVWCVWYGLTLAAETI